MKGRKSEIFCPWMVPKAFTRSCFCKVAPLVPSDQVIFSVQLPPYSQKSGSNQTTKNMHPSKALKKKKRVKMRTDFQEQLKFSRPTSPVFQANNIPNSVSTSQPVFISFPTLGLSSQVSLQVYRSLSAEHRGDWCLKEHCHHPRDAFHNIWKHGSKSLPFYTSRQATELLKLQKLRVCSSNEFYHTD